MSHSYPSDISREQFARILPTLESARRRTKPRTVASALRVMGLSDDRNYARYHQVLNRAVWSPRQAARILLGLLILYLDQGDGPLIFGIRAFYQSRNPGTAPRS